MTPRWIDPLLLGTALLAAASSAAWSVGQDRSAIHGQRMSIERVDERPWTGGDETSADVPAVQWANPVAQRRGDGWIYDLFTPPEIYYDGHSRRFSVVGLPSVTAPAQVAGGEAASFGLEVRAVQQPLFRLQLVGYVGGEGSYRGLFENLETGETFLAAGGRPLPALAVRIETFEVSRLPVNLPDSMTTLRPVARATVRDERTGETVLLTSLERCHTAAPTALVAAPDAPDTPREVRAGDTIAVGGATFIIDRIQLAPPCLDVTRATLDGNAVERRTLAIADTRAEENL